MNIQKKILINYILCIIPMLISGQDIISVGGHSKYDVGVIQYIDQSTYQIKSTIPISNATLDLSPNDLSVHINGKLYGVYNKYLYEIDTAKKKLIIIENFTDSIVVEGWLNGLCSDMKGTFYLTDYEGNVYSYQLNGRKITFIGTVKYNIPGDLEFIDGNLYIPLWDHPNKYIIHFDIQNGAVLDTVFDEDIDNTYFGLSNNATPCSTTVFHLPSIGDILRIDFSQDTFKVFETSDYEGSSGATSTYSYYGSLPNMRIDSVRTAYEQCDTGGRSFIKAYIPEPRQAEAIYSINGVDFQDSSIFRFVEGGKYVIHAIDSLGCYARSDTIEINQGPKPTVFDWTSSSADCNQSNGNIYLESYTGDTIGWSYSLDGMEWQNEPEFTGLDRGSYIVYTLSASGCRDSFEVSVDSTNKLDVQYSQSNYCDKGSSDLTFSINGGISPFSIQYSGETTQDTVITGLSDGIYSFVIYDDSGCVWKDSIELKSYNGVVIDTVIIDSADCGSNNGSIIISANSDSSIQYSLNSSPFQNNGNYNNLPSGFYDAIVQDAIGCVDSSNFILGERNNLDIGKSISPETCNMGNGVAEFSISGGKRPYTFLVDGDTLLSTKAENLPAGEYTIVVIDSNGCSVNDIFTIPHNTGPDIKSVDVTDSECDQETGRIQISGEAEEFKISGRPFQGDSVFVNVSPGTYKVLVEDSLGCRDSATVTVRAVHYIYKLDTICGSSYIDTAMISSGACDTVYITNFVSKPDVKFEDTIFTCNKAYEGDIVKVTGEDGCDTVWEEFVVHYDGFLNITSPVKGEIEENIQFDVSTNMKGITEVRWLPETGLNDPDSIDPLLEITNNELYKLEIEDKYGCKLKAEVIVDILEGEDLMYVPNTFSPNGDGLNDQFKAIKSSSSIEFKSLQIFDRWGTLLYESRGTIEWDGTYNGTDVPKGVYVYLIRYRIGQEENYKTGTVTLLR